MDESYRNNPSVMSYYVRSVVRYWQIMFKIILNRSVWSEITVDDLLERINSNRPPLILDIRTIQEFNGVDGHIPYAKSIALSKIKSNLKALQTFKEKEIVTVCPGGGLSLAAVDILVKVGFNNAKSLHGGMDLWSQKEYPVTKSQNQVEMN
ncbi:MAG: rhodanese-like domain-containing protein [Asgard group archaeon]|nr:rhodanese-like domain-containing protein [Asgard group archaeon]